MAFTVEERQHTASDSPALPNVQQTSGCCVRTHDTPIPAGSHNGGRGRRSARIIPDDLADGPDQDGGIDGLDQIRIGTGAEPLPARFGRPVDTADEDDGQLWASRLDL